MILLAISIHVFLEGLTMKDGALPGGAVPDLVFMIFQGMFFVITPALICGAFAERMKFSAMGGFYGVVGNTGLLPAMPHGLGGRLALFWW